MRQKQELSGFAAIWTRFAHVCKTMAKYTGKAAKLYDKLTAMYRNDEQKWTEFVVLLVLIFEFGQTYCVGRLFVT